MFGNTGLLSWLLFKSTTPDVAVAQLRQLRRQVPPALCPVDGECVGRRLYPLSFRADLSYARHAILALCSLRYPHDRVDAAGRRAAE